MADEDQAAVSPDSTQEVHDGDGESTEGPHHLEEAGELVAKLANIVKKAEELLSAAQTAANSSEESVVAIAGLAKSAKEAANDATAAKEKVQAEEQTVSALKLQIETDTAAVTTALPEALAGLQDAKKTAEEVTQLRAKSEKRVGEIEAIVPTIKEAADRIDVHENDWAALKEKIEGLLPGATSAGLAEAFHKQRNRFTRPQHLWVAVFILSIVGLLFVAGLGSAGLFEAGGESAWGAMLAYVFRRLPLAGPLIWLAWFAGRRYMDALRMEEEYAYKEAISSAFEGYKKQLSEIPSESDSPSPLVTLCNNQLHALSQPPGRIYSDGKARDITPATPVYELLRQLPEVAKGLNGVTSATPLGEVLAKITAAIAAGEVSTKK